MTCFRQDLVFDATRLRTELGWEEQVGFEGGIAETIRWERTLPDDDFVYDREAESALAHRGEVVNH